MIREKGGWGGWGGTPVLLQPQSRWEVMETNFSLQEGPWQDFKNVIMQVRHKLDRLAPLVTDPHGVNSTLLKIQPLFSLPIYISITSKPFFLNFLNFNFFFINVQIWANILLNCQLPSFNRFGVAAIQRFWRKTMNQSLTFLMYPKYFCRTARYTLYLLKNQDEVHLGVTQIKLFFMYILRIKEI